MAMSQGRDRLEVMVLEAHGLLAVEGGNGPYAGTPDVPTDVVAAASPHPCELIISTRSTIRIVCQGSESLVVKTCCNDCPALASATRRSRQPLRIR